jgi:hypothetical protein
MTPHWRHVNAVADPTHVRLFGVETFVGYCKPSPSFASFRPLTIAESFDTVFADLEPVKDDRHATVVTLARFLA